MCIYTPSEDDNVYRILSHVLKITMYTTSSYTYIYTYIYVCKDRCSDVFTDLYLSANQNQTEASNQDQTSLVFAYPTRACKTVDRTFKLRSKPHKRSYRTINVQNARRMMIRAYVRTKERIACNTTNFALLTVMYKNVCSGSMDRKLIVCKAAENAYAHPLRALVHSTM